MFSVVIPAKNEEQYLPGLLKDLERQSLKPLEVILADADSDDATPTIAKRFGARVVKGGLPGVGRNRGAAVAKGDILIFFDADTRLKDKDFLRRTIEEFKKRDLDVATMTVEALDGSNIDWWIHRLYNPFMRLMAPISPIAAGPGMMVRKRLHDRIGGFNEDILLLEDKDYAQRAARVGKFGVLHSGHILLPTRRFKKDGRMRVAMVYLFAGLYTMFIGPIKTDLFHYQFGHQKKEDYES